MKWSWLRFQEIANVRINEVTKTIMDIDNLVEMMFRKLVASRLTIFTLSSKTDINKQAGLVNMA